MAIFKKLVTAYRCERCGYEWLPRFAKAPPPAVCPNGACKSPYWNKPRQPRSVKRTKA
jgi:DNA-directed RNA polymerase subunit RPC12/RpoP